MFGSLGLVEMLMFGRDFEVDSGQQSVDEILARYVQELII